MFAHRAGRLLVDLAQNGFMITSFDTLVTQQGRIRPTTVEAGSCPRSTDPRWAQPPAPAGQSEP
ncbi:MAG TPA: hypothetical protein VFY56_12175, partial [Propionibacteriaceae bacterium]|nr:hypothetical protein [Propionibacteriaceae bacterium]